MTSRYGDAVQAARDCLARLGTEVERLQQAVLELRAEVVQQRAGRIAAEARLGELEARCKDHRRDLLLLTQQLKQEVQK